MKTVIAKLLTLVMVLMAVLTMAACGGKSEEQPREEAAVEEKAEEPAEEEAIEEEVVEEAPVEETDGNYTGNYLGQLDFSDTMKEQFSQSMGVEIDDPLFLEILLDLNEDETFNYKIDAEKFKADMINILKNHKDEILASTFEKLGYTKDQVSKIAQRNGYEDEEAFKDAFFEQLVNQADESWNLDDYKDMLEISGTYTVDDKTITMKSEDGKQNKITINDDGTLTMIVPLDGENVEVIMTKQK